MCIVTDAQQGTILETHTRGTFNLDRQDIGGTAQPADFEVLPIERAVLDLAAIVIRPEVARRRLTEGLASIWKWGTGGNAGRNEVARAAVKGTVNSRVGKRDPSTIGS